MTQVLASFLSSLALNIGSYILMSCGIFYLYTFCINLNIIEQKMKHKNANIFISNMNIYL